VWRQLAGLARHSIVYGLGNVAVSLVALVLTPLYTRYLTPQEFGAYALTLTAYALLSMIVDCGLTNSIARYYFDETKAPDPAVMAGYRRRLLSTAMITTGGVSIAIGIAAYGTAAQLAGQVLRDPSFTPLLQIMGVTLFFRGLTTAPLIYLRVTEQSTLYSILTLLQVTLFLGLNVVLVTLLRMGVIGVLYSQLLSTAVYSILLILGIRKDLAMTVDFSIVKELFRFGLPFVPVLLLRWVLDFSDRYLLAIYAPTSEVGIYAIGYRFGQSILLLVTAFSLAWAPVRFQFLTSDEPKVLYGRILTLYLAGSGLAWLCLALFAHEIILVMASPAFFRAAAFIAPVGFGYLVYGLLTLASTGMGVARKTRGILFAALVGAALNLALNILFIPKFGATAAAYSTIIGYVAMTLGSLLASQRLYPIRYEYKACLILLLGMTGLAAAASPLSSLAVPLGVTLKAMCLVVYCVIVLLSGTFRPQELLRALEVVASGDHIRLGSFAGRLARHLREGSSEGNQAPP
jgi:O-antigen/teichoic acid export membrane protein